MILEIDLAPFKPQNLTLSASGKNQKQHEDLPLERFGLQIFNKPCDLFRLEVLWLAARLLGGGRFVGGVIGNDHLFFRSCQDRLDEPVISKLGGIRQRFLIGDGFKELLVRHFKPARNLLCF